MAHAQVRDQDAFGKQLHTKKKGRFWKNLGWASLFVVGSGAAFGIFTQLGRDTAKTANDWGFDIVKVWRDPDIIFKNANDTRVNILIVGQDRNWKQGKVLDPTTGQMRPYQVEDTETRPRADTMIICSLDNAAGTMRMISLPRDTRVRYRDFDGDRHRGKLNAVWAREDGEKLLVKVLRDEFGVRIDKVTKVKLNGFTKLIDRVGGININVEGAKFGNKRTRMKYEDKYGGWKVDLKPGMQLLDGEQAHGYVRFRMDNEGDPGRVRRQQQVMRALAKKMTTVGVTQLPGLVQELEKLFDSNLTNEEMVSAAQFARSIGDPSKVAPLTPYGIYAVTEPKGDIILNKPENIKLFTAIFGSSFNPRKFLVLSPETKRDDIGHRNNDNPAALTILREAGLVENPLKTPAPTQEPNLNAPGLQ